jgi:hypothetical protein
MAIVKLGSRSLQEDIRATMELKSRFCSKAKAEVKMTEMILTAGLRELTERVRPNKNVISHMNDAGLDDATNNSADERNGEGIIDVELERGFRIVTTVVR